MQSITALAHLHAAIIYIVDISEQCGYTIGQQIALFESIKPLFANKPILLVANKIDTVKFEELDEIDRKMLDEAGRDSGAPGLLMSTATGEGVNEVKVNACDRLLERRVEIKMRGKRMVEVRNRLEVTLPKSRDSKKRPVFIPEAVLKQREESTAKPKEKDELDEDEEMEIETKPKSIFTGTHQYSRNWTEMAPYEKDKDPLFLFGPEWKEKYMLKEDEWKWDKIPEIVDGKNIADFYDDDIEEMLELLEKEEDERIRQLDEAIGQGEEIEGLTEEDKIALAEWRTKKDLIKIEHKAKKIHRPRMTRVQTSSSNEVKALESHLEDIGIDPSAVVARLRSRSKSRSQSRSRSRSKSRGRERELAVKELPESGKKRSRSKSQSRGFANEEMQERAMKKAKSSLKKINIQSRVGESDRRIVTKKPRHLFSGKRGLSADRR
jgi:nucleolar GTP-binding protein